MVVSRSRQFSSILSVHFLWSASWSVFIVSSTQNDIMIDLEFVALTNFASVVKLDEMREGRRDIDIAVMVWLCV